MKTYSGVKLHAFLISALQWLELSGQLNPRGKKLRYAVDRRLGGVGLDAVEKRKISFTYRESNHDSLVIKPIA
jgi:hypothetical protein